MFGLTMDQLALLSLAPVTALALLVIYLTRAGPRRLSGALLGGFFGGLLNLVADLVAFSLGLWHYASTHPAYASPWFYVTAGLGYGAVASLIGWRIDRRFGRRGVLIFLACVAAYGLLRDFLGTAAASASGIHLLVLAPGPLTVLADALCWVGCVGLAMLVMRLVAGPARGDRLAREPAAGM
jgi:hypothetical protein